MLEDSIAISQSLIWCKIAVEWNPKMLWSSFPSFRELLQFHEFLDGLLENISNWTWNVFQHFRPIPLLFDKWVSADVSEVPNAQWSKIIKFSPRGGDTKIQFKN